MVVKYLAKTFEFNIFFIVFCFIGSGHHRSPINVIRQCFMYIVQNKYFGLHIADQSSEYYNIIKSVISHKYENE